MTGMLYLVGVGPGDPELLTLKAARLLATADVVAYPVSNEDTTIGLDIARLHVGPAALLEAIHIPMTVRFPRSPEAAAKQHVYDEAAVRIAAHLDAGRNVVYICEGDPMFYGTAIYLLSGLRNTHRVVVVPGITSISAAASSARVPLSARFENLTILTGPAAEAHLREQLELGGSFAILKIGRHFDRVRTLLDEAGLAESAVLVDHATTARQSISPLLDLPPGDKQYFSLILVPPAGAAP